MQTAIGQRLRSSGGALGTASVVAALVVTADFALVLWNRYPESIELRGVLGILAWMALLLLVDGDLASVGLRLTPVQGWQFWARISLWIGLAVLACLVVGLGSLLLLGREVPVYTMPLGDVGPGFLRMCVYAPVLEETLYRLALCVPLAVLLGPWKAVVLSGLAFAGLHVAYGNPSPENLVGGFFLAWAFLKSESITVPMLMHGLGNLCALAAQVATGYWLSGAV